jgi:hypothetical protein
MDCGRAAPSMASTQRRRSGRRSYPGVEDEGKLDHLRNRALANCRGMKPLARQLAKRRPRERRPGRAHQLHRLGRCRAVPVHDEPQNDLTVIGVVSKRLFGKLRPFSWNRDGVADSHPRESSLGESPSALDRIADHSNLKGPPISGYRPKWSPEESSLANRGDHRGIETVHQRRADDLRLRCRAEREHVDAIGADDAGTPRNTKAVAGTRNPHAASEGGALEYREPERRRRDEVKRDPRFDQTTPVCRHPVALHLFDEEEDGCRNGIDHRGRAPHDRIAARAVDGRLGIGPARSRKRNNGDCRARQRHKRRCPPHDAKLASRASRLRRSAKNSPAPTAFSPTTTPEIFTAKLNQLVTSMIGKIDSTT